MTTTTLMRNAAGFHCVQKSAITLLTLDSAGRVFLVDRGRSIDAIDPIAPPAGDGASKWTWLRLRLLSARGKRASDRRSPHHSDAVAREVIHLRRRGPRCAVPTCRDLRRTTPPRHRQRADAARLMASRASRRVADFGEIIRPAWQIGPPNASPPSVGAQMRLHRLTSRAGRTSPAN